MRRHHSLHPGGKDRKEKRAGVCHQQRLLQKGARAGGGLEGRLPLSLVAAKVSVCLPFCHVCAFLCPRPISKGRLSELHRHRQCKLIFGVMRTGLVCPRTSRACPLHKPAVGSGWASQNSWRGWASEPGRHQGTGNFNALTR